MLDATEFRQALQGRPVTGEAIRNDPLRRRPRMTEQLPKESLRCIRVSLLLQEDVQHLTVLVDRPPQVFLLTANPHKYFVQMPATAASPLPALELGGNCSPKWPTHRRTLS